MSAAGAPLVGRPFSGAGKYRARTLEDAPPALDARTLLLWTLPRGPLLTAEQEQALARRMRGEDARVPSPGDPRPSPREAHDRLVEENMRLVVATARRYRGRGLPLEDLVQEGALALRWAAAGFDPDQGSRFAAYAILWVREAMVRALMRDARIVRVPPKVLWRIGRVGRAEEHLRGKLERDPNPAEIGEEVGMSAAQVEELQHLALRPLSLEWPTDGSEAPGEATLADPAPRPDAQAEQRSMRGEVRRVLATLAPPERRVLALRYGIGHDRPRSPAEVGVEMGVSRRQAERLELQALTRLRATPAVRDLVVYLR